MSDDADTFSDGDARGLVVKGAFYFIPMNRWDGVPVGSGVVRRHRASRISEHLAHYKSPYLDKLEKPVKGCTHLVYEGDASHFNDTANEILEKAGLDGWIGCDTGGIMGHVILCNPAE
jgi:hypothetical protein